MDPGGTEAVGEAVTGGLMACAVEPESAAAGEAEAGQCLNCGTALVGPHCHQCGQAGHIHRTVAAWWHDLAHGVLHFEGKIWRTLPLLAWRPGELTRRYVAGERTKFVSPLALFLFSVFLMFALFSAVGASLIATGGATGKQASSDIAKIDANIAQLETQRRDLLAHGRPTGKVDAELQQARAGRTVVNVASGGEAGGSPMLHTDIHTGWERLDHGIDKANRNPALLFYKLQSSAYKYSWALIPISLPFLWLLFLHRRRYRQAYKAYDHLVFLTYSIAFMSLFLIAVVLLRQVGLGGAPITVALLLVPPVHIYRQLRGAYALSRLSALWRTFALVVSCGVAMLLFWLLLLALGVLG